MERLTDKNDVGSYFYPKCFEKCDGLGASSKCDNCEIMTSVCEKLGKYEDLEEQGRLVKLPCKIGTKVYNITWWDDVQAKVVVKGKTYYRTIHKHKVSKSTFGYTDIEEIGKTVFLTKSEAEAKLKELRGGENESSN